MTWRHISKNIQSKGSTADKISHQGELAQLRRETQSQYFTPDWVSNFIFKLSKPIIEKMKTQLSVIDIACGAGALVNNAPEGAFIAGFDIDERCIDSLRKDTSNRKSRSLFLVSGLERARCSSFDIAVSNPPFSIHLDNPDLYPFESNTYGTYGPKTSARSDVYATELAIQAAELSFIILPRNAASEFHGRSELFASISLPKNTFNKENISVETELLIFVKGNSQQAKFYPCENDVPVTLLTGLDLPKACGAFLWERGQSSTKPIIRKDFTGSKKVTLFKKNRSIGLKFECGVMEHKALNFIMGDPIKPEPKHRVTRKFTYEGQVNLVLDRAILGNQDPLAHLISDIKKLGGEPIVCPTLSGYLRKYKRKSKRSQTPFKMWVKKPVLRELTLKAKETFFVDPTDIMSPIVKQGACLTARALGGDYEVTLEGDKYLISRPEAMKKFEFPDERLGENEWELKYPGKAETHPDLKRHYMKRIIDKGIDWLWPYQIELVVEALIEPFGFTAAWAQGTGKARMSIALCLLSSGKNLIVVEPGLMNEMIVEIGKLKIDQKSVQIIEKIKDISQLKKVNIISKSFLRSDIPVGQGLSSRRKKIADLLKRRINLQCVDEGGFLSKTQSQQSSAVRAIYARKTVIMDGTPIGNYPREMLPLLSSTSGDARPWQPYGTGENIYLQTGSKLPERGIDVFREDFCTFELVTNEFKDDMQKGAKREIPQLRNVIKFRELIKSNVSRAVRHQPAIRDYACTKTIQENSPTLVSWDSDHLEYYLRVAREFSQWYLKARENVGNKRGAALQAVLARISAVEKACDAPFQEIQVMETSYAGLTSKMRAALEKLKSNHTEGRKSILVVKSPDLIDRLAVELYKDGIEAVRYHGKISKNVRHRDLYEKFKGGDSSVLLMGWVGQRGLNIPEASWIGYYSRSWSFNEEDQIKTRILRPDQLNDDLQADYFHLQGSLDEYKAQMVYWKGKTADAALDYGDGIDVDAEFMHMDTILYKFCEETLKLSKNELLAV